jgi:acetyl-CoA carboxylase carboxyltransferase component
MSALATPATPTRLTALERLEALCDPGTLRLFRTEVESRRMGSRTQPGDGALGGFGQVGGRPILCYAQDVSYAGGSLGEAHAETIIRVLQLARRTRVPVVGFIESAGARLHEGLAGLGGYGRIFAEHVALSGVVPQISVICGACAGGGAYAPALTDAVIMTRESTMFLTGPSVVAEAMGEVLTAQELGGHKVHERTGVTHMTADDDVHAAEMARELLGYLPQHSGVPVPALESEEPIDPPRDGAQWGDHRHAYDVRDVARGIFDGGRLMEWSPRWARNVVCAFARLDGRSVGVIANQPRYLGGVLNADSSQKAARFVRLCNTFGLPLIVLVDTPGYLPGSRQENAGVIRHGAKLVHAFAQSTVPRLTVVLRKAFGGAFIAMNSRDLGADLTFAWPQAQIGVMAAKQSVRFINRRDIAAGADPDALAAAYTEDHLTAAAAAREGFVDEIVAPEVTRDRLALALATFDDAPRDIPTHGNIPL